MGFNREGSEEAKNKLRELEEKYKASESLPEIKDKPSQGGENTLDESVPFHKHPRWKEREDDWNKRLEEQERKFHKEIDEVKDETKKISTPEKTVPNWFSQLYGDDQDVYREYQQAHQQERDELKEDIRKEMNENKKKEIEDVEKAEDWIDSEIETIGADNNIDLSKQGGKNDLRNEFVSFMQDKKIFNEQGNLDFKTGWQFFNQEKDGAKKEKDDARKKIADNTGSDNRGEPSSGDIPSWQEIRRKGW